MNMLIKATTLFTVLFLSGCTGLFESKTCGIRNSQWERMSAAEQFDIEKSFHEKQRLADQLKFNKATIKQQNKVAAVRKHNEKAQSRRLAEESDEIKRQQSKIDSDLEQKQQAYLHPELIPENMQAEEIN
jgi:hypothetical protein